MIKITLENTNAIYQRQMVLRRRFDKEGSIGKKGVGIGIGFREVNVFQLCIVAYFGNCVLSAETNLTLELHTTNILLSRQ